MPRKRQIITPEQKETKTTLSQNSQDPSVKLPLEISQKIDAILSNSPIEDESHRPYTGVVILHGKRKPVINGELIMAIRCEEITDAWFIHDVNDTLNGVVKIHHIAYPVINGWIVDSIEGRKVTDCKYAYNNGDIRTCVVELENSGWYTVVNGKIIN